MPVWGALLGTLGYNIVRHRSGKSTLCSRTRPLVPPLLFCAGWGALTGWMLPHYCNGFPQ